MVEIEDAGKNIQFEIGEDETIRAEHERSSDPADEEAFPCLFWGHAGIHVVTSEEHSAEISEGVVQQRAKQREDDELRALAEPVFIASRGIGKQSRVCHKGAETKIQGSLEAKSNHQNHCEVVTDIREGEGFLSDGKPKDADQHEA